MRVLFLYKKGAKRFFDLSPMGLVATYVQRLTELSKLLIHLMIIAPQGRLLLVDVVSDCCWTLRVLLKLLHSKRNSGRSGYCQR